MTVTIPTGLKVASTREHSQQRLLGSQEMNAAIASVQSGQGPRDVGPVSCSASGTGSGFCSGQTGITTIDSGANAWTAHYPLQREGASIAYDAADGYVILFGGLGSSSSSPLGDTWRFLAGSWTNITSSGGPSPRWDASIAYDAADGYALLFGGLSIHGYVTDTWKFLGGSWTSIASDSGPSPREGAAMTYDVTDRYVILFGGFAGAGSWGDTWRFLGGSWTNITSSSGPSPRGSASIAYDGVDGYVILFGGLTVSIFSSIPVGDTWRFLGGSWTNITSSSGPSPRSLASMAYDSVDDYTLLFGGNFGLPGSYLSFLGDTWKFLAGSWTSITSSSGPPAKMGASITYDAADGYVVLFGGTTSSGSGALFGDTWKFLAGSWTNITSIGGPSPRRAASIAYDAADGYVILFGGLGRSSSALGDTWKFFGGLWTNITSSGGPSPRWDASIAYDAADGYVILFGGSGSYTSFFGGTWEFLGGSWRNITFGSGPSPREGALMTYDAVDGYVLLFGGSVSTFTSSRVFGDTWKFFGGLWTNITSSSGPPAKLGASMTYDAADSYVILFGGLVTSVFSSTRVSSDTWKFFGGSWTNITFSSGPPAEEDASMTYDASDGYVILFGEFGDTWKFSSPVTPPDFDFSLAAPLPRGLIVIQGSTSSASSITATLTSGSAVPVTFSVSSTLPSGVVASFSDNPCSPTCTFTVYFSATAVATLGTTIVTIGASGGGARTSMTLLLAVLPLAVLVLERIIFYGIVGGLAAIAIIAVALVYWKLRKPTDKLQHNPGHCSP